MNKAILIPIKPMWCGKIMNGDKTNEVRKNKALYKATMKLIEEQGYATFFMYCSKGNKKDWHLIEVVDTDTGKQEYEYDYYIGSKGYLDYCLEGKVVAKFTVRKVEEIKLLNLAQRQYLGKGGFPQLYKDSCLTFEELDKYLGFKNGYAYHIEDLVIFDKPKDLSEFKHYQDERIKVMGNHYPMSFFGSVAYHYEKKSVLKPLTKAPQNFCYVESEE